MVCSCVLPYITEMIIDEEDKFITTNYTQSKVKVKAINSDHNTIFVKMNMHVISKREDKREIFNLKNELCQFTFKRSTENAKELLSCLNSRENISVKCEKWKTYFRCTHKKKLLEKLRLRKTD